MLSGNEDTAQIYAYIVGNPTKQSYRELVKFRRRAAYFEYIVQLLQKALNEELNAQEVNEWCEETLEWMQKRNASILGTQVAVIKKPDVITVSGNVQKQATQDFVAEAERMNQPPQANKQKAKKKGGVKKYRLLIPLDLDLHEKFKVYTFFNLSLSLNYNSFKYILELKNQYILRLVNILSFNKIIF